MRLYNDVGKKLLCAIGLTILGIGFAQADTRGKLTGRILDQKNQPIIGANVLLIGTTIGASSDIDGYYVIINVPVGVYGVRFGSIGYQTKIIKEVHINAGQTTTLDVSIAEVLIESQEVTVVAERPLVDTRQTSSVAILGKDDINVMPVQSLNDIVSIQAGVVDGHFRGGRAGEVQYQVDGVSVNNPYDNSSVVQLDKSVLQEVQVISGTFDAEYGQAMSGVVNAVLRSGSEEKYEYNAELYGGDYVSTGKRVYPYIERMDPLNIQSQTFSISGPVPIVDRTSFLMNVRHYSDKGYLYGERRFLPTDTTDFLTPVFRSTGDRSIVPMNTYNEYSWQFKVTNRALTEAQLSYQMIGSIGEGKNYDFAYRLNPDGRKTQYRNSLVHGVDWTHSLSQTMFYTLSIRHNYYRYNDYAYKDVEDSRYIQAGWPRSHSNYELGAVIQGVDLGRFHQRTDCSVLKGSLTSQATKYHLIKAGLEAQYSEIGFGAPNTIVKETIGGKDQLVIHYDDTLYPGVRTYYPTSLAVYVQDRIEFPEFLVRIGIRSEYFDANSSIPSDLQNPANAIRDVPKSHPKRTTPKVSVAPRLGISYALSDKGALYFSYGHFYQMPGLGILYSNSNYDVLRNLASGGVSYGIMGNPDIKPEFTTQYEFGFKSQFGENLGIDVSTFYKDIRDLLGVEFISTYADADYARFTNVDFGSVYGVTLAYTQQFTSSLFAALSYTFQKAEGNSSDPRETATRAQAGADSRPRQVPFDWDQRHTLNATVSFSVPNDYSITVIGRYGSGTPYTPVVGSGFGAELEENSSSKPPFVLVDLRAEKEFVFSGMKLNVFGRVTNLFDTEYANGFVFATTGSPDYSLTPGTDIASLSNPSRYYSPRRIEIGLGIRY